MKKSIWTPIEIILNKDGENYQKISKILQNEGITLSFGQIGAIIRGETSKEV